MSAVTITYLGRRLMLAGLLAAAMGANAAPAPRNAPRIAVIAGWTRPVAGGMNDAGYLTIVNHDSFGDRLIGASSPDAAKVSIHVSRNERGVMTMRPVPALTIPGRGKVILAPDGYHLMLEGIRHPLKVGDRVPVSLTFDGGATVSASLRVVGGVWGMPGERM